MRPFVILNLLLHITYFSFGQSICSCEKDLFAKEAVSCDTITLTNKALLYYQFNCDTIWLTFENTNKNKTVLFSMGTELVGYNYRLGFQLTKEFKNSLLFRYGCPANGPCEYVLVSKSTGQQEKKFHELVYTSQDQPTNIIIYFTDGSLNSLTIYHIDTKKKYNIKIPGNRFKYALFPEQQFENPELKKNVLILLYRYPVGDKNEDWKTDRIIIDLKKYSG
jgi:hypothetical protein